MLKLTVQQMCTIEEYIDFGAKRVLAIPMAAKMSYEQIHQAITKAVEAEAQALTLTLRLTTPLASYVDVIGDCAINDFGDALYRTAESLREAARTIQLSEIEPVYAASRRPLRGKQMHAYFAVENC